MSGSYSVTRGSHTVIPSVKKMRKFKKYISLFLLFSTVYHAIYLEELTSTELTEKLAQLFNISPRQINQIFKQGPTGIHVLVSDEVRTFFSTLKFTNVC